MSEIQKYGDWRDDAKNMGVPLMGENSRFVSPVCPIHGWLWVRKRRINEWHCKKCNWSFKVDEHHYRAWVKKKVNIK